MSQQAAEAPCIVTSNFRVSMYPQNPGDGLAMPKVLADRVGSALGTLGHPVQSLPYQPPYGAPSGAGAVKMILIDQASGVMFGDSGRYLPLRTDYRAIFWEILRDHMGASPSTVDSVFPGYSALGLQELGLVG